MDCIDNLKPLEFLCTQNESLKLSYNECYPHDRTFTAYTPFGFYSIEITAHSIEACFTDYEGAVSFGLVKLPSVDTFDYAKGALIFVLGDIEAHYKSLWEKALEHYFI